MWTAAELRRLQACVMIALRSIDWGLIVLFAGFVVAAPLCAAPVVGSPLHWLYRRWVPDAFAAYQNSIAAAAVKRPAYKENLAALETLPGGAGTVNVVNLGDSRDLPEQNRNFPTWVALRAELHDACIGAGDPLRKLQEILGLPPNSGSTVFMRDIQVAKDGLFRPCVGSEDAGPPVSCTFDLPAAPAPDADPKTLRAAYDQMRFVTNQMWQSYRDGFHRDPRSAADYPFTGFPFTGMGWSYDWGPSSRNHYGISEFVIKNDVVIKVIDKKTPGEFCAKAK